MVNSFHLSLYLQPLNGWIKTKQEFSISEHKPLDIMNSDDNDTSKQREIISRRVYCLYMSAQTKTRIIILSELLKDNY